MTGLLSLDSSTETLAIALSYPGGRLLYEGAGGPKASERMVPEAMQLLARAHLKLADLDAIAFAAGPGAFTGLRTACAVAQGLALGAAKPVLALDSLMLVAEDARQQALAAGVVLPTPLWVAVDARMNEIYAAAYEHDAAGWRTVQAPALYSLPALQSHWEPAAVAGNALQLFEELRAELISDVPVWPQTASRALALAVLAEQAWMAGLQMDAALAMPVYVRNKVAQTTAERMAARIQP